MNMPGLIDVDGATVLRRVAYTGCQLRPAGGTIRQVPRIYRWTLIVQLALQPGRDRRLLGYDLNQN